MEFVRKAFAQIQEHLGTLGIRDKLLLAMCVVVMVGAFAMILQYAATAELTPLLDQDIPPGQLATIQEQLKIWDVTHKIAGNRVMVRAEERKVLLSRLGMADALPSDTSEGWRKWIDELDMWVSAKDRERYWQQALQEQLAQVIGCMPNVRGATVIVNPGSKRRLYGGPSGDPTASVHLRMQGGRKASKKLIIAAADMVAGAVDRLVRSRVNVIVDGASYRAPDEDSMFAGDLLEKRRAVEKYYVEKIVDVLGINNVLVGVNVEIETEQIRTKEEKYGEPIPSKEVATEITTESGEDDGQPGVRPNTGSTVEVAGGHRTKSKEEKTDNEYDGKRDLLLEERQNLLGKVKSVRATVNVPIGYFVRVYQAQTGKTEQPSQTQLDKLFQSQRVEIANKVLPIIGVEDTKFVEVGRYHDDPVAATASAVVAGTGAFDGSIVGYAKPAGLAVLAVSSLMMVLMMMRKAASGVGGAVLEEKEEIKQPPPILDTEVGPVGEAGRTDGVLQGMEVDEETVRVRKMAEQVASLVKEDPDAAAALVKQWMIQD